MKIKGLIDEDFVNYKYPDMFISLGVCNWKCCREANIPISICQNSELAKSPDIEISIERIYKRYISNPISKAIVIGGLEPFTQFDDVLSLVAFFRSHRCVDDIVIYTGYYEREVEKYIKVLSTYPNIIVKFGRFVPNEKPHYDDILGVNLISNNQYARCISNDEY